MNKPFLRPESGRLRAARAEFSRRAARIVQFGITALCVALQLAAFAPAAHAERADNDKPLNIEADNMTYDDLKQVNIFTGHVVATKGTIIIKADRVDVTQDPQGYQYATGTSAGGNLSYFRQKRDGLDE
jgi:lipopolysaccharide export system protein LptA